MACPYNEAPPYNEGKHPHNEAPPYNEGKHPLQ